MSMRPEVRAFAWTMEDRLQANDHKGGWESCSAKWLLHRCRQELGELERAIEDGKETVPMEAADVANFAMMIADNWWRENG